MSARPFAIAVAFAALAGAVAIAALLVRPMRTPLDAEPQTLAAAAGLQGGRITHRFDCFAGTTAGAKVSRDLLVQGVNFRADLR